MNLSEYPVQVVGDLGWLAIPGQVVFKPYLTEALTYEQKSGRSSEYPQVPTTEITVSIPKEVDLSILWNEVKEQGELKWGAKAKDQLEMVFSSFNGRPSNHDYITIKDGDGQREDYDRGCYVLQSRKSGEKGLPLLTSVDGVPHSDDNPVNVTVGDWVYLIVSVWTTNKQKSIVTELEGVRFIESGERGTLGALKDAARDAISSGIKMPSLLGAGASAAPREAEVLPPEEQAPPSPGASTRPTEATQSAPPNTGTGAGLPAAGLFRDKPKKGASLVKF